MREICAKILGDVCLPTLTGHSYVKQHRCDWALREPSSHKSRKAGLGTPPFVARRINWQDADEAVVSSIRRNVRFHFSGICLDGVNQLLRLDRRKRLLQNDRR